MIPGPHRNLEIKGFDLKLPFTPKMLSVVSKSGRLVEFAEQVTIFTEGDPVAWVPILISGEVRVFHRNDNRDRELMLYAVAPKEQSQISCVTFYSIEHRVHMRAIAEPNAVILYLPVAHVLEWSQKSLEWNLMVNASFRAIFEALVVGLKSAGTDGLECRILEFLRREARANQSETIHLTHEGISNYLGTSRVVVSRILKDCEKRGKLILKRGRITLTEAL
tara:strand:+ start:986 stop:1648 length:663 start_codon:yes stop_codon:yes gene_type:complete